MTSTMQGVSPILCLDFSLPSLRLTPLSHLSVSSLTLSSLHQKQAQGDDPSIGGDEIGHGRRPSFSIWLSFLGSELMPSCPPCRHSIRSLA
ncbi:hypothetical protein EYF80_016789 [Liparis tanakae]|uniref:Uncharacterized protein n=1 Tax=Liparis tanakae TaxID=230148 RepID=A0A4Z2I4K7_9TELE|nr:hypothetical protein EYF80_016789 [Liparis tanakae]